jgi:trk system potassium uptake protein TrkA
VVQADSTSVHALRQLGAADVETAAVCIGTDVEASVLAAAALVDLAIPNIWAKAITEAHGRILERAASEGWCGAGAGESREERGANE